MKKIFDDEKHEALVAKIKADYRKELVDELTEKINLLFENCSKEKEKEEEIVNFIEASIIQQEEKIKKEKEKWSDEADITLIMCQTQTTREKAIEALVNNNGDLLAAILEVTEEK